MPDLQVFFLLLFALFYSTMLASLGGHYVFSWQYLQKPRTPLRLVVSSGLFTLVPALIFWIIFSSIPSLPKHGVLSYIYIIFASQTVFVPYRIYHFIDCKWPCFLYGPDHREFYRSKNPRLKEHLSECPRGHLFGIAAFIVIPSILWLVILFTN